jgi:hypothetical protein
MHLNVFHILLLYITKFYRYTILYIVQILYIINYVYNVVYIVHIAYCTSYIPIVYSSPRMGSVVVEPVSQHSAFILCIRLSLDNPYGNNVGNIEATF